MNTLQPKACDVAAIHQNGQVEYSRVALLSVHLPFLARFGADASAWGKDETAWAFLTDSTFAGHFADHISKRDDHAIKDTALRVQETFLAERYFIVVAPTDAESAILPEMQRKQFEGGFFDGWIFVVDQTNAEVACQFHISAGSSDEIDFGGLLDSRDAEHEMFEDFEDNIEAAIKAVLPKGVEMSTGYGSIVG